MKKFAVEGFFPNVTAHRAWQACEVDATTLSAAARRGIAVLRKRDGIKGRRIREVHLKIRLVGKEGAEIAPATPSGRN